MKFRVVKSVRYKNRDLRVGEVLDLPKNDKDLIDLLQVGALEKYVEELPQAENTYPEKEQESLFRSGSKKNKKE